MIFGYFTGNGQNPGPIECTPDRGHHSRAASCLGERRRGRGAIAPNTGPMLDSGSMCASASQLFAASRGFPRPGSLVLLLLRR